MRCDLKRSCHAMRRTRWSPRCCRCWPPCEFLEREAAAILAPRTLGRRGLPIWLAGVRAEVRRVPFGRVLVIGPSNYPLLSAGSAGAAGAGCGQCSGVEAGTWGSGGGQGVCPGAGGGGPAADGAAGNGRGCGGGGAGDRRRGRQGFLYGFRSCGTGGAAPAVRSG